MGSPQPGRWYRWARYRDGFRRPERQSRYPHDDDWFQSCDPLLTLAVLADIFMAKDILVRPKIQEVRLELFCHAFHNRW